MNPFFGDHVPLCTGARPRRWDTFPCAMHGRCRGLPVLRAGCIHPLRQHPLLGPVPARSAVTTAELVYTFGSLAL